MRLLFLDQTPELSHLGALILGRGACALQLLLQLLHFLCKGGCSVLQSLARGIPLLLNL